MTRKTFVGVRFEQPDLTDIDAIAAEYSTTRSAVVRALVDAGRARWPALSRDRKDSYLRRETSRQRGDQQ